MAAQFDTSTRRTLTAGGWLVGTKTASRSVARDGCNAIAYVTTTGQWTVETQPAGRHPKHAQVVARGQESHPCAAAMDANEILWAFRDGRRAPDHLGGKLTDEGRAVL